MAAIVRVTNDRTREIARRLPAAARKIALRTAFGISTDIKLQMAEPKSGVVYAGHQASAPGEAPAIDTGNLVNSIEVLPAAPAGAVVQTGVEYAPHLEFGTVNMAPRPAWIAAAERAMPEFINDMRRLERHLG